MLFMRWCCLCADAAYALMHWCCWCWCADAADPVMLLMHWWFWYTDIADELMLLMRWWCWYCWCTDAADALMRWCYWFADADTADAAYALVLLMLPMWIPHIFHQYYQYICGEKICHGRNIRFLDMTDVEKSKVSPHVEHFQIYPYDRGVEISNLSTYVMCVMWRMSPHR